MLNTRVCSIVAEARRLPRREREAQGDELEVLTSSRLDCFLRVSAMELETDDMDAWVW